MFTYRVQGELCHRIGSLLPEDDQPPQFAQLYVYDTDNELANRLRVFPNLNPETLAALQEMLHTVNPYVRVVICESFILEKVLIISITSLI